MIFCPHTDISTDTQFEVKGNYKKSGVQVAHRLIIFRQEWLMLSPPTRQSTSYCTMWNAGGGSMFQKAAESRIIAIITCILNMDVL